MGYAERLAPYLGPSKHELAKLERAEQDLAGGDKGAILSTAADTSNTFQTATEDVQVAVQKCEKPLGHS